jgi:hypothetical protein
MKINEIQLRFAHCRYAFIATVLSNARLDYCPNNVRMLSELSNVYGDFTFDFNRPWQR